MHLESTFRLFSRRATNRKHRFLFGFDPTRPDPHAVHTLALRFVFFYTSSADSESSTTQPGLREHRESQKRLIQRESQSVPVTLTFSTNTHSFFSLQLHSLKMSTVVQVISDTLSVRICSNSDLFYLLMPLVLSIRVSPSHLR